MTELYRLIKRKYYDTGNKRKKPKIHGRIKIFVIVVKKKRIKKRLELEDKFIISLRTHGRENKRWKQVMKEFTFKTQGMSFCER